MQCTCQVWASRLAACLCVWLVAVASAQAEDWPQWRGPKGDGVSNERNLPVSWTAQRGIAWRQELPGWGTSVPAIWQDRLFVTCQDEDRLLVVCLNRADGSKLWETQVGSAVTPREAADRQMKFHELHNLASPSPVTNGEQVVVHFGNGLLAALTTQGDILWQHDLQQQLGTYTIWWGHANSPVLHDGLVISVCMQDNQEGTGNAPAKNYVVAHDLATGQQKWLVDRVTGAQSEECDAYTTPVLAEFDRKWHLVIMGGNQLDAYDPATGKQRWFLPGLVGGRTVTGPVIANDLIYATEGMRGELVAVPLGGTGELDADAVEWRTDQSTPDTPCPVAWKRFLFTITDNGVLKCYNAATGVQLWRERLEGDYKASPVVADDRLYLVNTAGQCSVVKAAERFEKVAVSALDDTIVASPAISGGRLYFRGKKGLIAVGK